MTNGGSMKSSWLWPWYFLVYALMAEVICVVNWSQLAMVWVWLHWALNPFLAIIIASFAAFKSKEWLSPLRRTVGIAGVVFCAVIAGFPYFFPNWPYEYVPKHGRTAEQLPKRMTRVVIVWTTDNVPHHPFAERPSVHTRATNRYCRLDMERHPSLGIHQVIVVNEPDAWEIDLVSKTALHTLDPGPTFNCHQQIFTVDQKEFAPEVQKLEFGREAQFFRMHRAKVIDEHRGNKHGRTYEVTFGDQRLRMEQRDDRKGPRTIELIYGGKTQRISYLEWNDRLPFNANLFAQPKDVTIKNVPPRIRWVLFE